MRFGSLLVVVCVAGTLLFPSPAGAALTTCFGQAATVVGTTGTSGNDVIVGTAGADTINGLGGNDLICGFEGNDTISGGDGDDTIHGDSSMHTGSVIGNDQIDGGSGSDWVDYSESAFTVNVSLPGGTSFGEGNDPLSSIENIQGSHVITGSGLDDFLGGDAASNIINGGDGNDYIYGRDGDDIIEGGFGNDAIVGGAGNFDFITYFISGAVNADLLAQTASADGYVDNLKGVELLSGSCYSDVLRGDSRTNWLVGGPPQLFCDLIGTATNGDDVLDGRGGQDVGVYFLGESGINANLATKKTTGADEGTDTLTKLEGLWGTGHNDTLVGDGGNNSLVAGAGNDTVRGGGGSDYLFEEAGSDKMYGDSGGHDVLSFAFVTSGVNVDLDARKGTGVSVISGIEGIDGSRFADTIYGNSAVNYLWGGAGGDKLFGRGGRDKLDGAGGTNRLNGGPGTDGCVKGKKAQCENASEAPIHPLDTFTEAVSRFRFKRFRFK